ncbi:MgtC/SapB family protein [Pontibacter korlensis]|uniref:MgtC/SapB family protein n=1 Tax=Pontibacter korlensis TaxID=400092 RepID=UPI00061AC384|nr:MgtC/SapB family protein [Pontibacter korlensis]
MELELFQKFGISLGLGLLVGLQRQHRGSQLAGIRTFPLITLLGSLSALLATAYGSWIVAAAFIGVAGMAVAGNLMHPKCESMDVGQTTETTMLLMFALGAYVMDGNGKIAVAVGATVAVLLHLKGTLHRFVDRIGEKEIRAIMQFAVISMVVLPILPDETFGPFDVLNPRNIWLMVVLIVGIGLLGYFAYKAFGGKAGTVLSGILGGLISSTATTVSYARRSKGGAGNTMLAALVIFIASTVALVRIVVEVALLAPGTVPQVLPPFGALFVLMLAVAGVAYFFNRKGRDRMPEQGNPAQLKTALVFGLVYAVVTLATAAAKEYLGREGLYIVGVISGLADVDAITLSTARLMNTGQVDVGNGWRVILVATLSNLVFKAALAGIIGNRSLFGRVAMLFGIVLAGGLLVLWWWPEDLRLFQGLMPDKANK